MKKEYSIPMIMIEEFTINHTIADCGDPEGTDAYECLTGPQKDNGSTFSSSLGCSRPCLVFDGCSKAQKLGGKSASFSGVDGILAYCVKGSSYAGTSEWYQSGNTVMHKNSHPMDQQYHCMVRGYVNEEEGYGFS